MLLQHAVIDTIVADDPDMATPEPAVVVVAARVSTRELIMQVYVDGKWHRRTPDMQFTSCGKRFHGGFCPTRREELADADQLCDDPDDPCFTEFEGRIARKNDREKYESPTEPVVRQVVSDDDNK